MAVPDRQVGKVLRIMREKGFFFARTPDGKDWFCHRSELRGGWTFDALGEGMEVEFLPVPDALKGPRATEITVL